MKLLNKAVKAIIKNDKNQILILKRTPFYKRKGSINIDRKYAPLDSENIWDLPGGRLYLNEDILDGLKREVKEETNLDIEIINQVGRWNFIDLTGKNIDCINFLCSIVNSNPKIILSEEHKEHLWVSLEDIKKYTFKDKSIFNALV